MPAGRATDARLFAELGRTRVMGIVNATPDSFSDAHLTDAVEHGRRLVAAGADLLDVGGESTRPGAPRVPAQEELDRVLPVIAALAGEGALVSVDTTRSEVAAAAVAAGAVMVNDVSGGQGDPRMLATVARLDVPYVVMHSRGPSVDMQSRASYDDPVADVCRELAERRDAAERAGVKDVVLDPGLGFAKESGHSWALVRRLAALRDLGRPLLVGASRKSFLGVVLDDRPAAERDAATTAVTVLAAQAGAWAVRVHDVRSSADAVRVVAEATR